MSKPDLDELARLARIHGLRFNSETVLWLIERVRELEEALREIGSHYTTPVGAGNNFEIRKIVNKALLPTGE